MSAKSRKKYFCPYCATQRNDKIWTREHIIPAQLGGSKSFSIIVCRPCNNKIGKLIEEPAINSVFIRNQIGDLLIKENKIRGRRSRKFLADSNDYGIMGFRDKNNKVFPVKFKGYYDIDNSMKRIRLFPNSNIQLEAIKDPKRNSKFFGLIPAPDYDHNLEFIGALANKIIYATCFFLWGREFTESKEGQFLRQLIWSKRALDEFFKWPTETPHTSIKIERDNNIIEIEAYNNYPNHTIHLSCDKMRSFGIVNLFGGFESLLLISQEKYSFSVKKLKNSGIIFLNYIHENKFEQLTEPQYLSMKEKTVSDSPKTEGLNAFSNKTEKDVQK